MPRRLPRAVTLLTVGLALVLAACGDDAPADTEVETTGQADCWEIPTRTSGAAGDASEVQLGLERVGPRFGNPVSVLPDPEGRTLVVELGGRIRPLEEPRDVVLGIRDQVGRKNEQGLLGVAFAPDGDRLWVHYTEVETDDTVVREFEYRDGVATGEGPELLRLPQAAAAHNGGSLLVGPDGFLYLALGDAGVSVNGQDPSNPYGAISRFDACTTGELVAAEGNPGLPDARVWQYGLRNPYRIWFDDGDLYIADVGLSDVEEIDVVSSDRGGLNFGWPVLEGRRCHTEPCDLPAAVPPVVEHTHDEGICALIGGLVYRGEAIPELAGHYLYGDFCAVHLQTVLVEDGEAVQQRTHDVEFEGRLLGFGHDANGEVYLGTNAGHVYRLVAEG